MVAPSRPTLQVLRMLLIPERTGGYLVTMGVYTGTEDFKDKIVRHFMVSVIAGWVLSGSADDG